MFLTRGQLLIARFFVITVIAAGGPGLAQPSSDTAAVTAANEAFYAALSSLDASATEPLWVQDSYVSWISPRSRAAEVGWSAVQANLKFFGERFAQTAIKPVNVHVTVNGALAWVVGGEVQQGTLKDGRAINNTALVYRLYCEEGLTVRRRRRKRMPRVAPIALPPAERLNQRWTMDFIEDRL